MIDYTGYIITALVGMIIGVGLGYIWGYNARSRRWK